MKAQENKFVNYSVIRYDSKLNVFEADNKFTSIECAVKIYLNDEFLTAVYCSPNDLEDLIVGILAQRDLINNFDEVLKLDVDKENFIVNVTTSKSSSVKTNRQVEDIHFNAKLILSCADKLLSELSKTHEITNGVHSGVIFDGQNILAFREDVGRHNVFDKLYGWSLRNNISLVDKVLIFSGRCSSEMMTKLDRMGIRVVAAKSVPTTLSINIAKKLGVTLIARMAPNSFCIYTNPQRILINT